jgi:hypothetical protein
MRDDQRPVAAEDITAAAHRSFDGAPDDRLRFLLQRLVAHLHAYARDVRLTRDEWEVAIAFLTETGQTCTDRRQEFILLSDTLGLSMLVDALQHPTPPGATESTVLGPFHADGSPLRPMGSSTVEQEGSGEPTFVTGTVRGTDGRPVGGALLDVWQNAANQLYAVQDAGQPPENLRGRFRTGADHLPTMRGRRDPRRPVHIQPDIAVLVSGRLSRVQAHPDPYRLRRASHGRPGPAVPPRSTAVHRRPTRTPRKSCPPRFTNATANDQLGQRFSAT